VNSYGSVACRERRSSSVHFRARPASRDSSGGVLRTRVVATIQIHRRPALARSGCQAANPHRGHQQDLRRVHAVDSVNLRIYKGEMFALVGASGCGKTTLLRMLADLPRPSSGRILIEDVDMTKVPPHERPVNMMFQSYALFPHMSVRTTSATGCDGWNWIGRPRPSASRKRSTWCSWARWQTQTAPALRRPAAARGSRARAHPPAEGAAAR
jgi:hypothetical protein